MSVRTPTDTTGTPPPEGPQHKGLSRSRTIALVAIFAVLVGVLVVGLVAQGSGDNDSSSSANVSPTAPPATQPQADQPPPLLNTGEDWPTIVTSMLRYREWLSLHPNPDLLDNVMWPEHKDYADVKLTLTNMATKGWRYDPPPSTTEVQTVRLSSQLTPTKALIFVRYGPAPEYRLVDQTGAVIAIAPATSRSNTAALTLSRTPDDPRWRLEKAEPLS